MTTPKKKKTSATPNLQDMVPPHSVEAEMGVLSSVLMAPKTALSETVERIGERHFHVPQNQVVFNALVEMWSAGKNIDLITVTQELRDKDLLDGVGGAQYITQLFTYVPSASNLRYYLDILRDKYVLRELIASSSDSLRRAYLDQGDPGQILAESQLSLQSIEPPVVKEKTIADYVDDLIARMERGDIAEDVVRTGITKLDEISPLHKGDMPLLTGERKSGKSITAITILANICFTTGRAGLYLALEDSASKIVLRLMSGVCRIPVNRLLNASKLSKSEIGRAMDAFAKIRDSRMIVHSGDFDLSVLIAKIKREFVKNPDMAAVVVDYAQLVSVPHKKSSSREQEVATVSRALRVTAGELGVPIIVLSQLNEDGRSRESRSLEQDATANWNIENPGEDGKRIVNIRWQRDGESDRSFPVTFLGEIARVENYHKEEST